MVPPRDHNPPREPGPRSGTPTRPGGMGSQLDIFLLEMQWSNVLDTAQSESVLNRNAMNLVIGNAKDFIIRIKSCFYACTYAWLIWPPTAWHAAQAAHERNPGTLCQRPSGAAPGQLANAANAGNAGNVARVPLK